MKFAIHCLLTLLTVIVIISLSHFLMLLAISALIVSVPYLIFQWRKAWLSSSRFFA